MTDVDTVLQSDFAALAVARNIIMPQDEITLAAGSDVEIANGSLILGIRATTALSNTARRLYVRNLEVQHLNQQLTALRQRVTTLTNEKKEQRRELRQVRRQRDRAEERVTFYKDFVETRMAELEDEMDEVQEQSARLRIAIHGNTDVPYPSGMKKAKSV